MKIGFVGTGSIGNPVAQNLLAAGHKLFVHDTDPDACRNLISGGAIDCVTPAKVAEDAEMIFLSLPSHLEVSEVCFGPHGLFGTIHEGTFLIDLTTVSVHLVPNLQLAARTHGVRYLCSPVSQGVESAKLGQLSLFVGGEQQDYEDCLPILRCIGEEIIYTGSHTTAIAAKLLTNLLWFVNATAIGEALVLGVKSGLDLTTLQRVILNSCGNSWVASHDIPSIYDGSYDPSFTTKLCCKDLGLIDELAAQHNVPLEIGALVKQIFRRAYNIYGADSPELSVIKYLEDTTGTNLNLNETTGPGVVD